MGPNMIIRTVGRQAWSCSGNERRASEQNYRNQILREHIEARRNFMKKLLIGAMAFGLAAGSALAQNGNPCPGKKEYQFNIIGVPKNKNPDLTNNNGHRVFVDLNGPSTINFTGDTDLNDANGLQCGSNFQVLDANGTGGSSALVLVPCTNVTVSSETTGICFDVWATTLGGPGSASVDVVCTFDGTVSGTTLGDGSCLLGGAVDIPLERKSGKPVQTDVTKFFRASGCFDTNGTVGCQSGEKTFSNVWIFNLEALQSYYWVYDNNGLRVTQIRFCASDNCGSFGVVP